eukprot:TRINITY_DN18690_c0_g1_i3.p1 TRINITY_DN18690_c0_g1~~TRINITY_DN18690_c0_g1_i3.p1  ORF type:complete len:285 (+),score=42.96 TRINITY_DN18690_c0_g1_i3:186-1040(+)
MCIRDSLYTLRNVKHLNSLMSRWTEHGRALPEIRQSSMTHVYRQLMQMHGAFGLGGLAAAAYDTQFSPPVRPLAVLCALSLALGLAQLAQGTVPALPRSLVRPVRDLSRVWVVGHSGAGKSTTAERLSRQLGAVWIDLDELWWLPEWQHVTNAQLVERLEQALAGHDRWVVSGNYVTRVATVLGPQATAVLWLRPPFGVLFAQLLWRTFVTRWLWGARCCNGNRESLWRTLFSTDSILYWAWTAAEACDKKVGRALATLVDEAAGIVVLQSRKEVNALVESCCA